MFSAILARRLADAEAQRHPKITLSGAGFSEAGDLGDLPARLKAAENLRFLWLKCGGVGGENAHPQPISQPHLLPSTRHAPA